MQRHECTRCGVHTVRSTCGNCGSTELRDVGASRADSGGPADVNRLVARDESLAEASQAWFSAAARLRNRRREREREREPDAPLADAAAAR